MKRGLRLGIDLGGTQVKLALVDGGGRVVSLKKVDTPPVPRAMVSAIKKTLAPWFDRSLLGTGVGVAGDVDSHRGVVRISPNLGWKNVPLKKMFSEAGLPRPLYVENDATAAAWGAYHVELKRRSRNLIVLTLGTGVGGGLVLEDRLYRGASGSAGELGHMVIDPKGPACPCGTRGCLESFVGGVQLVRYARRSFRREGKPVPAELTPHVLYRAARRGEKAAKRVWERVGRALGTGLSNLINILNPDTVLLCGGVAGAAPLFLPHARAEMERSGFAAARRAVRLRVSTQNQHLGVVGAALLVP